MSKLSKWGIHLTQVATRCCGRAKASTKKRIPRLLLWRGVGLRSASDSRSCRPKAATAMNSRVGRLGGHSHDSRNLTFLFQSREATTYRVYLNEVRTLRRWMLAAGLWSRRRKLKAHRKRRQRKAHFGELIQVDGSHHQWLEGRGPKGCLMNFVDDATGVALGRFSGEETTWAAADLLEAWVRQYGVPKALYCDWKNVYKRKPTSREAIEGIEPETQFGRMCTKLGIRIIAASSPQAKGRVERHHGTHQDRMIKKMRLQGIADYEAANRYLGERYLPEHNAKFACEPAAEADFHQRLSKRLELKWVFCLEAERVVSNDLVVRFENRFLQLKAKRNQSLGAGARVTVQQGRDGELRVRFQDRAVAFDEIDRPQPKGRAEPKQRAVRRPRKPAADHPWRRPLRSKKRNTANS